MTTTLSRVAVTDAAASLLRQLTAQHGPLMFHQSGGCCDGSAPMCYPVGMFLTGPSDVKLGDLDVGLDDPIEVFISASQFEYWKYTHLTIDVVPAARASASRADRHALPHPLADARRRRARPLRPALSAASRPLAPRPSMHRDTVHSALCAARVSR
jgi:uncharacterized protein (DUF779 family)